MTDDEERALPDEPDLPTAPDDELIRTIEETDSSVLPNIPDQHLMRRVDLEDPSESVQIFVAETDDE